MDIPAPNFEEGGGGRRGEYTGQDFGGCGGKRHYLPRNADGYAEEVWQSPMSNTPEIVAPPPPVKLDCQASVDASSHHEGVVWHAGRCGDAIRRAHPAIAPSSAIVPVVCGPPAPITGDRTNVVRGAYRADVLTRLY